MAPVPLQELSPGHSDCSPIFDFSSVGGDDNGGDDGSATTAAAFVATSEELFSWPSEDDDSAMAVSLMVGLDTVTLASISSTSSVSPADISLFLTPTFRLSHFGLVRFLALK